MLEGIGEAAQGDEFAVMEQLHDVTDVPVPKNLTGLKERKVLHKDVIAPEEMLDYVLSKAAQKEW